MEIFINLKKKQKMISKNGKGNERSNDKAMK